MAGWDPRTTYDVSEKELGLMKKRADMRSQLKAYWKREFNNPHTRVIVGMYDSSLTENLIVGFIV